MPEGQSFPERLRALRQGGIEALAPLWIEQLSPDEALGELAERQGAVFRLQEAKFLLDLGRRGEAFAVLSGLDELPPGLSSIQADLHAQAGEASLARTVGQGQMKREVESLAAETVMPITSAHPVEDVSLEKNLAVWLSTVRSWRRALSV